jgi:hypothetical protein
MWKISWVRNQRESRWHAEPIFRPWRWRRYVSPKRPSTPNGLHGVIPQKMVLFKMSIDEILTSCVFFCNLLQSYTLPTHTPTFNATFHEYHAQMVNSKQSILYNILHFTYPHQNIINTHRIDTIHWHKGCSTTQLTFMSRVSARQLVE